MERRSFISSLTLTCCSLIFSSQAKAIVASGIGAPPPQPHHMIEFEALGGVGDGDPNTGRGTDNARAFARAETMAQQGYGIKFKPRASYKTTEQINIHSMYWVGDETSSPIIFGWFSEKGKKIIGRSNKKDPLSVCIMGINFHRCGPFAEHGIVIDNIERLYFDGAVTSEPGAQGGAIGISPFFPERRHSRNCFIKARINNSGDFGVQLGSVSGAIIDVTATDCYREVIGIEPVVSGTMEINKANIVGNDISVIDPDLPNGTPILYCYGSNSRGPLTPGKHYFVIKNDNHTISLADSRESSAKGHKLDLKLLEGEHYFAKSAVVEDIAIRFAKIIDNHAKKPTLYANTMGYIVITGNSGGYMNNIKLDNVYIEGNQIYKSGKSVGIYVQGAEDLILSNINVHGCDDAVVVSDGWLNGMFDERGRPIRIENGYSKLSSKNILVTDPNLTDFRSHGVLFRGNGGTLRGGKFSSRVKDAKLVVRE